MTDKEILEGNKLIAEFMGWQLFNAYEIKDIWEFGDSMGGKEYTDIWVLNPTELFLKHRGFGYNVEEDEFEGQKLYDDWKYSLKYNSSWDLLMPVIEKISSTDFSSIDIHSGTGNTDSFSWCNIKWHDSSRKFKTSNELNSDEQSLIKATYKAVVEFIKWYNENKD